MDQQTPLITKIACPEYIEGLEKINFSSMYIPKLKDVSERLKNLSGWTLLPTDRIVSNAIFFDMLSQRQFPIIRK
ncbi:MAG: phenylalanine 4-monooxygenase, partial [Alphaproteobacteria bacterium]|nr:phenylalanine 4-monooxygenase [Alphaproteobacteria bacterium]